MSVYSIGVDLANIDRIERMIETQGDRFIKKVFTGKEIAYCSQLAAFAASYAARFAAKEALFKATGKGLRDGMSWQDIEVINNDQGKPEVFLYNETARLLAGKTIHLSLSHSGNMAIAMVVVDNPHPTETAGEQE